MKKIIALFITLALALTLASCASVEVEKTDGEQTEFAAQNGGMPDAPSGEMPSGEAPEMPRGGFEGNGGNAFGGFGGQGGFNTSNGADSAETVAADDQFTSRDLEQTADTSVAENITLKSGEDVTLTAAGVYVLTGSANDSTVIVEAGDEDKVQIVLDGVTVTNEDSPAIYVKNADKVFVTTTDTVNTLSVTGTFTSDGDTNTDAVIFSKDDLVINGVGTLNIKSSDNGITSKDDLKITGGTIVIDCASDGLEANDSIRISDGDVTIKASKDGMHCEYEEDDTVGYIYITGGKFNITSGDDGIHATTVCEIYGGDFTISAAEGIEATQVVIGGGSINITASDDGVNAAKKSSSLGVIVEIDGGDLTIKMGAGDTDAIDSNGNIVINGGNVNITGQSAFDYDGTATYNGGTLTVNGQTVTSITNQFGGMGGGMMPGGGMTPGGQNGQRGGQPGGGGGNGRNGRK